MPSLYLRKKSGVYYASFSKDGQKYFLSTYQTNRERAEIELERLVRCPRKPAQRISWEPYKALLDELKDAQASEHTRQHWLLAERALKILSEDPDRFAHILLPKPKRTTLYALGRVADPETLKAMAEFVCQRKIGVALACKLVINARNVSQSVPRLGRAIAMAITNFYRLYPGSYENAADVLEALAIDYREKEKPRRETAA